MDVGKKDSTPAVDPVPKIRRKYHRRIQPRDHLPLAHGLNGVVQRFECDGWEYEQRYTRCGPSCRVCNRIADEFDFARPGHGPYWYRRKTIKGRKIVKYVGKALVIHSPGSPIQEVMP